MSDVIVRGKRYSQQISGFAPTKILAGERALVHLLDQYVAPGTCGKAIKGLGGIVGPVEVPLVPEAGPFVLHVLIREPAIIETLHPSREIVEVICAAYESAGNVVEPECALRTMPGRENRAASLEGDTDDSRLFVAVAQLVANGANQQPSRRGRIPIFASRSAFLGSRSQRLHFVVANARDSD